MVTVTATRLLVAILTLAILGAWFFMFRPTSLGGSATYIVVKGESMEPTYNDGDLVILRDGGDYKIGDIVAYATEDYLQTGRLVIHRIVGTDEIGFITRGDNRATVDRWRPTSDQIPGNAWLHLPAVGTNLAKLAGPGNLRMFFIATLVLFVAGSETKRRLSDGRPPIRAGSLIVVRKTT
jgi:signal peptidase I